MKHCPRCRQTYTDETLKFCRGDGTLLQTNSLQFESSDTLILAAPSPSIGQPTQLLQSETAEAKETTSPIEEVRNSDPGKLKAASGSKRYRRDIVIVSVLILLVTGLGFWFLK